MESEESEWWKKEMKKAKRSPRFWWETFKLYVGELYWKYIRR